MENINIIRRISNNIFDFKSEMMGFAIFILMIFHSRRFEYIGFLQDIGDVGVDIFCFLGGFTCALSYLKTSDKENGLSLFYKKRFIRVFPPYFIFALLWNSYWDIIKQHSYIAFIKDTFFYDVIVNNGANYWYISAILFMYAITPLYIKMCKKSNYCHYIPLVIIIVELIRTYFQLPICFVMMWHRLPIYLLGISFFLLKDSDNVKLSPFILYTGSIISIIITSIKYFHPELISFAVYHFIFIPLVLIIVYVWNLKSKFWSFLGKISLENYLLHWLVVVSVLKIFPNVPLVVNMINAIILAIALSYIYHLFLRKTIYKIKLFK